MPSLFQLEGPKLRPVTCDPRLLDPEQIRIGTLVEMEHTADKAAARQIALHHLCETFPHPYYVLSNVEHEQLLLRRGLSGASSTWKPLLTMALIGAGVLGVVALALRGSKKKRLGSPQSIASEAKSPEEYARRVEAWSASEAKPPSVAVMAKAYGKASPKKIEKLIRQAREERLESREKLWSRMARGLRGGGLSGYRVWYGTSDAHGTFRVADDRKLETVEQATKLMRSYKRQGFWTWVEDDAGNFVPVPGAKSERVRKSYPLRERDKPLKGSLAGLKWKRVRAGVYTAQSAHGEYTIDGNNAGRNRWTVTYPDGDYAMVDALAEAKANADSFDESRSRRALKG